MKRLLAMLGLCMAVTLSSRGQSADDQYMRIYSLIQEADVAKDASRLPEALGKYGQAQTNLIRFQRAFPNWNSTIIDFRLGYLNNQINAIRSKTPPSSETEPSPTPNVPAVEPVAAAPAEPSKDQEVNAKLNALQTQISMLEADKQNLQAKLKEAFAVQPAAVDPQELAKAEENVRTLQKENDLLKASLSQAQIGAEKQPDTKAVARLKQQLSESNRKLEEASDRASKLTTAHARDLAVADEKLKALQTENESLKTRLTQAQTASVKSGDTKLAEQLKQQLAESNRKLNEAAERASNLATTQPTVPPVAPISSTDVEAAALRLQNEMLKKQLTQREAAPVIAGTPDEVSRQLAEARAQIATLESDTEILQLEKMALANRAVQPPTARTNPTTVTSPMPKPIASAPKPVTRPAKPVTPTPTIAPPMATTPTTTENVPVSNTVTSTQMDRSAQQQAESMEAELLKKLEQTRQEQAARKNQRMGLAPPLTPSPAPVSTPQPKNLPQTTPQSSSVATSVSSAPPEQVNQQQNDLMQAELLKKLEETRRQQAARKNPGAVAATTELAMAPENSTPVASSPTTTEPVASNAEISKLLKEAQQAFSAGQFDKAEENYLQILKLDSKNVFVLADLAAIETALNHPDDADKYIQQAVVLAPNDSYSLSVLGNLRLQQGKYEEALTALNHAAQLSPDDARIQNYLGVTLSQLNRHAEAETALRKAIQLEPKYGDAQKNLAVVYLSEKPPLTALARWHYQKALAAGAAPNPNLEKMLQTNTPGTAP